MSDASAGRNPVEVLAEEFLERYRRGERPSAAEYAARYPELAGEIAEVFPALVAVEEAGPWRPRPDAPPAAHRRGGVRVPDRLGDFRIVREVGRGGMGVVYEAVQESLGRSVALKVLSRDLLDRPSALERFRRETQTVAALHHSHIVQVFGVGEDDGHHYFAMQFIRGQGLDRLLHDVRRGPGGVATRTGAAPSAADAGADGVPPTHPLSGGGSVVGGASGGAEPAPGETIDAGRRGANPGVGERTAWSVGRKRVRSHDRVAQIGLQVAEALAYAHGQGVIHRDIKPSNLLVDHEGTVWVVDFGLAKLDGGDPLSATSDVLGTLRYMAPERFEGRSDRLGDIYGLGATLYELLTLRPAFAAADQARLVREVLDATPSAPRTIDRRISRDLETVVLKAMAREPSARYATAGALAEDLRRFLEDRSILARRSTAAERSWRWCRRNPRVAALAAACRGLLVLLIAGLTLGLAALRREQAATLEHLGRAEEAGRAAVRSGRDAREKLWASYLSQARAGRLSRRVGQRFESLAALAEAAALDASPGRREALRDEAVACLALPDLKATRTWDGLPEGTVAFAFDADLARYARKDRDGNVSVRRTADDRELTRLPGNGPGSGHECFSVRFAPGGRHLAVGYQPKNMVKVWDLDRRVAVVNDPGPVWGALDFSPDGRLVAVGHLDGSIPFFELATGREVRRWAGRASPQSLAFRPDGAALAVTTSPAPWSAQVRAAGSGDVLAEVPLPERANLAWHPDGTTLATACFDRKVYLWDVATGRRTATLEGHPNLGITAAFSPAGDVLVSNSWEARLRFWEPRTGNPLFSVLSDSGAWFGRDGRLALESGGRLGLYQLAPGREYRTLIRAAALGRSDYFYIVPAVRRDNRLLAVGLDDGVGLWDLADGSERGHLPGGLTSCVLFTPSGDLITCGLDGVRLWPVREGPGASDPLRLGPPRRLPLPANDLHMDLSRDGRVLALALYDGAVVLDLGHPDHPVRIGPHKDVRRVGVSPDGRWVATASHNGVGVKVWETRDGTLVKDLVRGTHTLALFSGDGRWLMTNEASNACRLWETGSWREVRRIGGHLGLGFSHDGRVLAVLTPDRAIRLVDPSTGRDFARLESPDQHTSHFLCFSPDGSQLVTTSQDGPAVHAWDLRAVRRQLAGIGLDWDAEAYPQAVGPGTRGTGRRVEVEGSLGSRPEPTMPPGNRRPEPPATEAR